VDWSRLGAIAVTMDPLWTLLAFLCYAPMLAITAWRWSILLRVQNIVISFGRAFELCLVSHFFNAFLFGVTGGDMIKIYYATKTAPETKEAAGLSVVVDRLIGLAALLVFAVILCAGQYDFLNANAETRAAVWCVLAIAAAAVALGVVSLFLPVLKNWAMRRGWWQRLPLRGLLERLLDAYLRYHSAWGANIEALVLSFFNHSCNFVMAYCVARALHLDVPFWPFLSILPIINLLIALPISISGLGVREGLSVLFFSLLGYDREHAMTFSLTLFFLMLIWSLIGGLLYLRYEPVPVALRDEVTA
jgi:uncharacterized protein (TIRG00374 family)